MAIKITQSDTFRWPVKVSIPKDGGGYDTGTFDAVFKRLSRTEAEEIGTRVAAGEMTGLDAVRQILVGWSGVLGENEEVPFSEANRERFLEIPGVGLAIFRVFTQANAGAAQEKN